MTDRIRTITVILDHDYRDDDLEPLLNVFRCIKHVADVVPGQPVDINTEIARSSFRHEASTDLVKLLRLICNGAYAGDPGLDVLCNVRAELSKVQ